MADDFGLALGIYYAVLFGVPVVLVIWYCLFRIYVIEAGTAMVVERWETYLQGNNEVVKVNQTLLYRIDLRENVMDFPLQPVITRDNVEINVHPMALYRLVDPVRVCYETYDLSHAVEKLIQTTLRSIIGDMGLDDTLASREEIERGLQLRIKNICLNWGLEIKSVELLEIIPTSSIQEAMHKQLGAERGRRAAIVTADGYREQVKTEAEGQMQAEIAIATGEQRAAVLRAKSTASARVLIAKAEAEAINIIGDSLKEYGVQSPQYIVALKYIEAFQSIAMAADTRKVFLPIQTDVVGSLAHLSAPRGL